MSNVYFTSTILRNLKKQGKITPDADGYYTVVGGGLNVFNSVGHYYTADGGARQLFEKSSAFMRRVTKGTLYGEVDHPSAHGMKEDEWIQRLYEIPKQTSCIHIKDVWLDDSYGKLYVPDNRNMIAIMLKVKPSGGMSKVAEDAFQNNLENACFSIRSFTRDYAQNGRRIRVLDEVVTFDLVTESGVERATKYHSPACETFVDVAMTNRIVDRIKAKGSSTVGLESSQLAYLDTIKQEKIFLPTKSKLTSWK